MNKNYISHIAETKIQYHKARAKMAYEEKIRIIIQLQKIDTEMRKNKKNKYSDKKLRMVWQLDK